MKSQTGLAVAALALGIAAASFGTVAVASPALCSSNTTYATNKVQCSCGADTRRIEVKNGAGAITGFRCEQAALRKGWDGTVKGLIALRRKDLLWVLELRMADDQVVRLSMTEVQAAELRALLERGPTE